MPRQTRCCHASTAGDSRCRRTFDAKIAEKLDPIRATNHHATQPDRPDGHRAGHAGPVDRSRCAPAEHRLDGRPPPIAWGRVASARQGVQVPGDRTLAAAGRCDRGDGGQGLRGRGHGGRRNRRHPDRPPGRRSQQMRAAGGAPASGRRQGDRRPPRPRGTTRPGGRRMPAPRSACWSMSTWG